MFNTASELSNGIIVVKGARLKKIVLTILLVAAVALGGYVVFLIFFDDSTTNPATTTGSSINNETTATNQSSEPPTQDAPLSFDFAQPKKSAHYVSNTPEHGDVLGSLPQEVVVTFNFDLSNKSTISVTKDGKEVSTGSVTIDSDKLVMRKKVVQDSGTGLYTVNYNACWPDGSCHDGQFQFGVE